MAIRRSHKLKYSKKLRRNRASKGQGRTDRRLRIETLEDRRLLALGPQLQGVLPDTGSLLEDGEIRDVAPRELLFVFDEDQVLDAGTIPGAFQVERSGLDGSFGDGNEVIVTPGYIGLGETSNEVVMRFAERLVDDHYRIIMLGTGPDALRNVDGQALNDVTDDGVDDGADERLDFELDLGAQIIAVVPQPVSEGGGPLTQARNQIVVYFNDDDLFVENTGAGVPTQRSAENPNFYKLYLTQDTVTNTDDDVFTPTTVDYDPDTDRAVLTFASNLDILGGPGTYRLRIGTDEELPPVPMPVDLGGLEPGSSFDGAKDISADFDTFAASSILVSEQIVSTFAPLNWPGAMDEPGMRNIPVQGPYLPDDGANFSGPSVVCATIYDCAEIFADDLTPGIRTALYNFRDFYGFDPEGNALKNQITEPQKQRTREVFELYGELLGIDFIESADLGMTIVTGDMRALDPTVPTGPGGALGLAGGGLTGTAIMDAGEQNWSDLYGGNWFQTAMHEIGHLLSLGHVNELAPITIMNDEPILAFDNVQEPDFPGDYDIAHGQHRFRPENNDIDLYQFELETSGQLTAETLAERLPNASLLDTTLTLYKQTASGVPELISRNDDYFSDDSFISLDLEPGVYFIGVAASGNDKYDPVIEDTGVGGTSAGIYDLRLTFRPGAVRSITDADNVPLNRTPIDGDLDGVPGGTYNFWFRVAAPKGQELAGDPRTIFVDKKSAVGNGTLANPYGNLQTAMANARPGDIVRVVGNGGLDGDITTVDDNLAYEIGFGNLAGSVLSDGAELIVPSRVTLMIDEGAIFKMKESQFTIGSTDLSRDLSSGAVQVLGTPDLDVILTSYQNESIGVDTDPLVTMPGPGDWGGIQIRNDLDRSENRFLWDQQGIFLNYVNHADFSYGGGKMRINGVPNSDGPIVNPIRLSEALPTISFNTIQLSSDAAISADPNSFRELNFNSPAFQRNGAFTSDYTRVGPDIDGNTIVDNSTNGLRIRVQADTALKPQTVTGRWDDTDIVHVLRQTLRIQGTPGGPINEQDLPPSELITLTNIAAGGSLAVGRYNYRLVFVDVEGNESLPSLPTETANVTVADSRILLQQLPPAPAGFVSRRLYRSDDTGNPNGEYRLVAELDPSDTTYMDQGLPGGGLLDLGTAPNALNRARLDASLTIDPGTVVKLEGARIEVQMGAQLLAEGLEGQRVIFTSRLDDKFGGSGTFDTNNDHDLVDPSPGNWSGIYVGPEAKASFDNVLLTFGGGESTNPSSGFNVLEFHQADGALNQ